VINLKVFNITDLFLIGIVFVFVLSIWLTGLLLWITVRRSRMEKVHERLGLNEKGSETRVLRLWKEGQEVTTTVQHERRRSFRQNLDSLCEQAGWKTSGRGLMLKFTLFLSLTFMIATIGMGTPLAGLGASVAVILVFWIYWHGRIDSRSRRFEQQFVEALELAARSLRAGHPLAGAFQLVSEEMPPPVSNVFTEICQRQALGTSLEQALRRVAEQTNSFDMRLFATSVCIQLQSGGNLADMMTRLAAVIRDRMRLGRRVRVLTAQVRLSKRVLLVLPFVLLIVMSVLNGEYMEPLFTTDYGKMLLVIATCGMTMGVWIMNRLSVLKY
jgi:tight adherence protein B